MFSGGIERDQYSLHICKRMAVIQGVTRKKDYWNHVVQEATTRGVLLKKLFIKYSQNS